MPAAAVIPALIAYTKVVAVKKLVVGFRNREGPGRPQRSVPALSFSAHGTLTPALNWAGVEARAPSAPPSASNPAAAGARARSSHPFTLNKLGCSKRAKREPSNTLAWDNEIRFRFCISLVSRVEVMIKRDSWGH